MPQNDILKKYLDAGLSFTSMTQSRAEAIVKDLVKAGELQTEQAQATVLELVDKSRKNTEKLLAQVRGEVRDQVKALGLATQSDIERLEKKIAALSKPAAAKKAPARKAAAKKAPARKKA